MNLPVEDTLGDILSKAQKGLGLSTETLAERTGLSEGVIRSLRRGEFEQEAARSLAAELGLNVPAAVALGEGSWRPESVRPMRGFEMISTPFHDWQVNAFVLFDEESRGAVAFDTGTDARPMLDLIREKELDLRAIILTHTHRDHVEGLRALRSSGELQVYVNAKEDAQPKGAQLIEEGFSYRLGRLSIAGIETPGHSAGGMSFLVEGLERPLAIVGDALFAGSMGGANVSYEAGLASLARLLELPAETMLAPGHGPLTTVAEERRMNAFSSLAGRR